MKLLGNYVLAWLAWNWHCHIVASRSRKGAASVYHDRPDWFVRDMARLLHLARNTTPDVAPLVQQASEEWRLRLSQREATN